MSREERSRSNKNMEYAEETRKNGTIGERINVVHRYYSIVQRKKWENEVSIERCILLLNHRKKNHKGCFYWQAEIRGAVFSRARAGKCRTMQDSVWQCNMCKSMQNSAQQQCRAVHSQIQCWRRYTILWPSLTAVI
jgi:hypothetical protein